MQITQPGLFMQALCCAAKQYNVINFEHIVITCHHLLFCVNDSLKHENAKSAHMVASILCMVAQNGSSLSCLYNSELKHNSERMVQQQKIIRH